MVQLDTLDNVPVGVLGATGTVGQRFIKLISTHPFFRLKALGASQRSSGQPYYKAVKGRWKQVTPIPASARDIVVQECVPEHFAGCAVIFSGLDADVAGDIGELSLFTRSRCPLDILTICVIAIKTEHWCRVGISEGRTCCVFEC